MCIQISTLPMIGNSGSDKHAELIGSLGQSGKQSPHSKTFKPSPNHKEIYKYFFVSFLEFSVPKNLGKLLNRNGNQNKIMYFD